MKKEFPHINSTGFKTPENYFEALEENILAKIALQKKISKQNPFQVPENYFGSIDDAILEKVSNQKIEVKVIPLYKKKFIRYAAAVAAVFVLAISIFQFNNNSLNTADDFFTFSSFIESDYLDLSIIDFEYLLSDEMLNDETFLTSLGKDEIEEYLLYELDDTYLLYE